MARPIKDTPVPPQKEDVQFQEISQRMDQRLDELWDAGVLNQKKLDELRSKHLRTDLK